MVETEFHEGMRTTYSFCLLSIHEFGGKWRDGQYGIFLKQIYLFLVSRTMSEDGSGGKSKFS